MMRMVGGLLALIAVSACASSPAGNETAPEPDPTPEVEPLVGTWERVTRCQEAVSALTQAGLDNWVLETVAGNGFIPGVTDPDQITEPADPCMGAVPRVHSHFFTQDGRFGSLDWNGEQVDDGTYEIVDNHTFVISKEFPEEVTFNYTVRGDDSLTFEAAMIPDCAPDCFEAGWSVVVAYPGKWWHRVS
jgi:hypothetical protein